MLRVLRTQLDSSSLASIAYDSKAKILEVVFRRTGYVYHYFDVPRALYHGLIQSDSKGAFLNSVIKPNFDYVRADIPLA